ncbi:MAG: mechanosensitive ion channel family protein [Pirellulales bacterium]|nr:mechanosensitive ion channel family protein [Pirellulales bacterium]
MKTATLLVDIPQSMRLLLAMSLIVFSVNVNHAMAQADAEDTETVTQPAVTTANPAISVEDLQLRLSPLTVDELAVEADAWQALLQAKMAEIVEVRLPQSDPSGAPSSASTDDLVQLQADKTALADRLNVVIGEMEAKGGDAESYKKYVAALPGLAVDVFDTASVWAMIKGWIVSEQGGQRWGWNIAKFLLILIVFMFAARIVARFVRHAASRFEKASQLWVKFLEKFTRQLMRIIGLIVALAALEVNISPLLAAVGAAGFVIAFALQGTLSNLASGLLILAYRPFDVGDVIEAAGISGIVDSVSLFTTHVRTFDNKVMIVPNNDIWGGTITNATASDTRRVDMTFGIGYDDDIEKAKNILEKLISNHELVLKDPAPVVHLHELADSSVNFICRPWTKTGDYWTVYWDITRAVKEEFDAASISIPYPQQDVHIHQSLPAAEG